MDTEKTEITSMPEGMTSDELDALTTGEEQPEVVAQEEAPKAESLPVEESVKDEVKAETDETKAEETKEEPEPSETDQQLMAKDAKIGDFRRKNRDLEIEKARLEGELKARESLQSPDKPKSPLEIAEAAFFEEYGTLAGFSMDGELYRKQRAFDDKRVADKTAKTDEEKALTTMNREVDTLQTDELSPDKVGEGADFKSVVALGKHYLDAADIHKIELISHRDGIKAGVRKTYELCKEAILSANNDDTKLLQNALGRKSQSKTTKTDIDALTTGGDTKTVETEEDTHSKRLTSFIFD